MSEEKLANPAPLGLMGFGMTTVLLNLHNAGVFPVESMLLSMGVFYGGVAQVIAGIMEFKKGNTFGTTAFTSYGLFWISLASLIVIPELGWAAAPSKVAMAAYLIVWGIFTSFMFVATLKLNRALQVVFVSLAALFFLLAVAEFVAPIKVIAGYEGVFCGLSAMYSACALVLNEVYERTVLPV